LIFFTNDQSKEDAMEVTTMWNASKPTFSSPNETPVSQECTLDCQ